MRKWEEIVKDKLEEPDGTLPEHVFAEFRARLDGADPVPAPNPAKKLSPLVWIMAAAVAAGLAAVLFLRQPETPANGIQIVEYPTAPVASFTDSSEVTELLPSMRMIAQAATYKAVPQVSVRVRDVITPQEDETEEAGGIATSEEENKTPEAAAGEVKSDSEKEETGSEPPITTTSPYIPQDKTVKPVRMKFLPAAGIMAGSGLLAAIAVPVEKSDAVEVPIDHIYYFATVPYLSLDEPFVSYKHAFPFKGGLSVGIPVAERWKITTGLEYSLYPSSFTFLYSGEKKQYAHYLGVPVRLDWILASNKWLDVYLGGGLEGDYCIRATLAGEPIKKDGFSLSLLGAGGVQINVARHIGIYVEPELSWRIPSEKNLLQTYRSGHPFLFSVATGFRINLED